MQQDGIVGFTDAPIASLQAGAVNVPGVAYFDNSDANLSNPDPSIRVRWGEQTTDEMAIVFYQVLVDPAVEDLARAWRATRRRNEAGAIIDIEVRLDVAVPLFDGDFFQFVRETLAGMFLEETLSGQTLRTTHE